jgi:hypothetical protein
MASVIGGCAGRWLAVAGRWPLVRGSAPSLRCRLHIAGDGQRPALDRDVLTGQFDLRLDAGAVGFQLGKGAGAFGAVGDAPDEDVAGRLLALAHRLGGGVGDLAFEHGDALADVRFRLVPFIGLQVGLGDQQLEIGPAQARQGVAVGLKDEAFGMRLLLQLHDPGAAGVEPVQRLARVLRSVASMTVRKRWLETSSQR